MGFSCPDLQEMANVSFGLRTLLCWCRLGGVMLEELRFSKHFPMKFTIGYKMTKQKTSSSVKQKLTTEKKHLQFFQMWYWELRTFVVCFSKNYHFLSKTPWRLPPPPGKLTCPMKRDGKKTWILNDFDRLIFRWPKKSKQKFRLIDSIADWNPKQQFINGRLVKQPFPV